MYVFTVDIEISSALIIGIAGLIITLIISVQNQSLSNQQMMKQLFTEFNQRYGRLNDCLVEIEKKHRTIDWAADDKTTFNLKKKVLDYFNLCAEEYYWYKKGRIDETIWSSWQSGMNYWYNKVPAIKALWELEMKANGPASYYIKDKNAFFNNTTDQE